MGILRTDEEVDDMFNKLDDITRYPDRFYHWGVTVNNREYVICAFGEGIFYSRS